MEYNRNRSSSGKNHRNSESHNNQIKVNKNRQKKSSPSKQHNGVTLYNQQEGQQSKFIKPVDMAILGMIPKVDPDLIAYLTELLRSNKPDQQDNTFRFRTPENPGNIEDHTPIQTRILKELRELQRKKN